MKLREELEKSDKNWDKKTIEVWTVRDPKKFEAAYQNDLNYLVFYPQDDYIGVLSNLD